MWRLTLACIYVAKFISFDNNTTSIISMVSIMAWKLVTLLQFSLKLVRIFYCEPFSGKQGKVSWIQLHSTQWLWEYLSLKNFLCSGTHAIKFTCSNLALYYSSWRNQIATVKRSLFLIGKQLSPRLSLNIVLLDCRVCMWRMLSLYCCGRVLIFMNTICET